MSNDSGSTKTRDTKYVKTLTLLWQTKTLLAQALMEHGLERHGIPIPDINSQDRRDHMEALIKRIAKA